MFYLILLYYIIIFTIIIIFERCQVKLKSSLLARLNGPPGCGVSRGGGGGEGAGSGGRGILAGKIIRQQPHVDDG
jgi:hypothetical protein